MPLKTIFTLFDAKKLKMKSILFLRKTFLEQAGLKDTALYKVADMAERLGGYFSYADSMGFPIAVIEVAILKGLNRELFNSLVWILSGCCEEPGCSNHGRPISEGRC